MKRVTRGLLIGLSLNSIIISTTIQSLSEDLPGSMQLGESSITRDSGGHNAVDTGIPSPDTEKVASVLVPKDPSAPNIPVPGEDSESTQDDSQLLPTNSEFPDDAKQAPELSSVYLGPTDGLEDSRRLYIEQSYYSDTTPPLVQIITHKLPFPDLPPGYGENDYGHSQHLQPSLSSLSDRQPNGSSYDSHNYLYSSSQEELSDGQPDENGYDGQSDRDYPQSPFLRSSHSFEDGHNYPYPHIS